MEETAPRKKLPTLEFTNPAPSPTLDDQTQVDSLLLRYQESWLK